MTFFVPQKITWIIFISLWSVVALVIMLPGLLNVLLLDILPEPIVFIIVLPLFAGFISPLLGVMAFIIFSPFIFYLLACLIARFYNFVIK